MTIAQKITDALPECGTSDMTGGMEWGAFKASLLDAPEKLEGFLRNVLEGPCEQAGSGSPMLLVIDDFEQMLDKPESNDPTRVSHDHITVVMAILRAFKNARTDSRLVLTSRYQFHLSDETRDLTDTLLDLPLPPTSEIEAHKQYRQTRKNRNLDNERDESIKTGQHELVDRAIALGMGNPGLHDLLYGFIHNNPQEAEKVLSEMEDYKNKGSHPKEEKLREFLENLAIGSLLRLAGPSGMALLRALALFRVPAPLPVVDSFVNKTGGDLDRLVSLGLLGQYEDIVHGAKCRAYSVDPLVEPKLAPELEDQEITDLARLAVDPLFKAWVGDNEEPGSLEADLEITRLAIAAKHADGLIACAAGAMRLLNARFKIPAVAKLGYEAIEIIEAGGKKAPVKLLHLAGEALVSVGEAEKGRDYFAQGISRIEGEGDKDTAINDFDHRTLLRSHAESLRQTGKPDDAYTLFKRVYDLTVAAGEERNAVVILGQIADILLSRGEPDEALRIRQEEVLPIFESLKDVRSIAVCKGKIADILLSRGESDEALRIRQEEVLPIFEGLKAVREIAVCKGKIADILLDRGEPDEALRIRQEEVLPI
ncbi:MAG: hypothetical protein QF745_05135, partial [Planctomycetota bacterium]|nr:hypothetical protein [Planctomycetota bacterium]